MKTVEYIEKINKPGLWFVYSNQPATELIGYVYDLAVELGLPIVVYSNSSKKEIQNNVIEMVKKKCVDMASDELERNWLEQEMTEYNTHGQFWYPEEMNDYVPNGSFWSNYVHFDEFKILSFTNSFSNLYLIDNLSDLWFDDECDLPSIEKEAVEYRKTMIVFVSSYGSGTNKDYINKHLLIQNDDILTANRLG